MHNWGQVRMHVMSPIEIIIISELVWGQASHIDMYPPIKRMQVISPVEITILGEHVSEELTITSIITLQPM